MSSLSEMMCTQVEHRWGCERMASKPRLSGKESLNYMLEGIQYVFIQG